MSRLIGCFESLKERNERALICYIVAGDPDADRSLGIMLALDRAGVDIIELGIPFSDPLADGPAIQAASFRSLTRGASVAGTFELVSRFRKQSQMPIVLMTYFNPTLQYGVEKFASDAAAAGVDGVIQTDLTPEESDSWVNAARRNQLDTVFLVAPTSTDDRIEVVARRTTGFIYAVSRTGVTGVQAQVSDEVPEMITRVRAHSHLPVCVGFGVSKPEQVRSIGTVADGIVVGSALVQLISDSSDDADLISRVEGFACDLKSATRI